MFAGQMAELIKWLAPLAHFITLVHVVPSQYDCLLREADVLMFSLLHGTKILN